MTKEIHVLLFFAFLQITDGLTCLQCNNVPAPKHCTSVTECFDGEVCGVERIYSEFGSELFNVGCMVNDKCSSSAGDQRCVECCNTTLCNAAGCGETGYTSNRGPVCYSCPLYSAAKPCHTIDFCGLGEKCLFEIKREFGELIYTTKCLDSHACREGVFIASSIVGRDLDIGTVQFNPDRRSIIETVCRFCCDGDVCNKGCNKSVVATAVTTPATHCIPDPCEQGRCYDVGQDFVCVCNHGFEGRLCNLSTAVTTPATGCVPDPCEQGRCYDVGQDFVCVCNHGFEGRFCNVSTTGTTSVSMCIPDPCEQGRCYEGGLDFVCVCDHGFGGRFCNLSTQATKCTPNLCGHGKCFDGDSTFKCICDIGYFGALCNTRTQSSTDCYDILHSNISNQSGVYDVTTWKSHRVIQVVCDMETDGGGWTVFQSRFDGSVDFFRNFSEYEYGFGSLYGEFWLGLSFVQEMAEQSTTELRLDLTAANGNTAFEVFQNFRLDNPPTYSLRISSGTGTAGDHEGLSYNRGYPFIAYDSGVNSDCPMKDQGGWWYFSCAYANLNGEYVTPGTEATGNRGEAGVTYRDFQQLKSLKATQMKFRRI